MEAGGFLELGIFTRGLLLLHVMVIFTNYQTEMVLCITEQACMCYHDNLDSKDFKTHRSFKPTLFYYLLCK